MRRDKRGTSAVTLWELVAVGSFIAACFVLPDHLPAVLRAGFLTAGALVFALLNIADAIRSVSR